MNKKKLAVIGASYLQLPLVLKAKEMGLEVYASHGKMERFALNMQTVSMIFQL